MTAIIVKARLDRQVAELLGKKPREVSAITATFLHETIRALVSGGRVQLDNLGELYVTVRSGVLHRTTFRGKKSVQAVPAKYYVSFKKAAKLREELRLRFHKENIMEKYGVDEGTDQENLEKKAAAGCPVCGKKPVRHGGILMCPDHGSEPFEQKK